MLTLDTVVKRADDLLATEVDGDLVMLSLRTNQYYGLKQLGGRIWEMVAEPVTGAQIVEAILAEYEVERAVCEADTLRFLSQLEREKLIDIYG